MTYFTIGQLNIPISWIAFFVAIFYSDYRSKHADEQTTKLIERIMYTYIVVWKFSYVMFSFNDFIQAPLSIIYFDGGMKGHLLAIVLVSWTLYRKRQLINWQDGWSYWARFAAVFQIMYFAFQQQWILAVIWLVTLLLVEKGKMTWALFVQFLLLASFDGFTSSVTLFHSIVLITMYGQRKNVQYIVIAGLLLLVSVMLGDVGQKEYTATARTAFDLPTTTGEQYRLTDQPQQLTVVNFFATWCPPCKAEMPHLQSFAENLPAGISIIGVNLTARDDGQAALQQFMETYDVTYPILLDETDAVGDAFGVLSIPTTVLLNAEGEELERIVGPVSEDGLLTVIQKYHALLEE